VVVFLYALNFLMVLGDTILCYYYRRKDFTQRR
jgi:hypothetical protein